MIKYVVVFIFASVWGFLDLLFRNKKDGKPLFSKKLLYLTILYMVTYGGFSLLAFFYLSRKEQELIPMVKNNNWHDVIFAVPGSFAFAKILFPLLPEYLDSIAQRIGKKIVSKIKKEIDQLMAGLDFDAIKGCIADLCEQEIPNFNKQNRNTLIGEIVEIGKISSNRLKLRKLGDTLLKYCDKSTLSTIIEQLPISYNCDNWIEVIENINT